MIFGSKALSVAVLGVLVLSEEASAATLKKGKHDNDALRKAQRKLKGSKGAGKGGSDAGMATRAGSDTTNIPSMPVIEPRMIDIPDAGGDGGDEVEVDSLVEADATAMCNGPVNIAFGPNMAMCKYQYTASANARKCTEALRCTQTSDITQLTFKYTSVPFTDPNCTTDDTIYCPFQDKAEGGRVWIVENTDMFQMKLMNAEPKTYESLKWHIQNDLDTAMPKGKTLYNQEVWVGDEFSINISPSTLSKDELAYFAFDKDGDLITFAVFDRSCPDINSDHYSIGDMLGNSMITSFRSMDYGIATSTVFIDSYGYTVENMCDGADPAVVYSLDRTFCTSSCGEDKWDCPEAEGYNPYSCVADGKTQLGCRRTDAASGSPFILPNATASFEDSIDGKGPIDLLETKIELNVNAMIRYPEYWTAETTPEGGVSTGSLIDLCL